MSTLDPHQYALNRIRALPKEFSWDASKGEAWRHQVRTRLRSVIGMTSDPISAIDIESSFHEEHEEYALDKLTYTTRPGMRAMGYLLTPAGIRAPMPAVICVPGHGPGVDTLVGKAPADYQNLFALQCVRAGFVTLAIEQVSFGHRESQPDSERGSSCMRDSMAALMLGETMIGWRCHDAIAALDLLRKRREVDAERIAIMGISGGGLTAFWSGCLDEGFAATYVSGYFNTFFDSILSIDHCVDNYAPGLASVIEMPDMAALVAPRHLFVESGKNDHIFPAEAFGRACDTATRIYQAASTPARFSSDLFEGDHVFWGKAGLPKLRDWFEMQP